MQVNQVRKRVIPVVLVVAIVSGGYWWWSNRDDSATDPAALGGTGTIESEQVMVTPQVPGRIIETTVEDGSRVSRGDVIARLDPALLQLQVDQADVAIKAARAAYVSARKDDDSTSAEKAAAKAQLDQARIARRIALVQLGYATVTSPIDGVVSSLAGNPGENAMPGSALAVISNTESLTVTVYIAEGEIGKVAIGDSGVLRTDSLDKVYSAAVEFIASAPEFAPSSLETKDQRMKLVYQVRLRIEGSDDGLKPGMPVDVELQ